MGNVEAVLEFQSRDTATVSLHVIRVCYHNLLSGLHTIWLLHLYSVCGTLFLTLTSSIHRMNPKPFLFAFMEEIIL